LIISVGTVIVLLRTLDGIIAATLAALASAALRALRALA
jgi:hypothetical protein